MPSVSFLKEKLQAQIAPGDDTEFLRLLTEADMRLLEFGRWRWTRTKADFTPVNGIITLTSRQSSILAARIHEDPPVDIWAEEYEFVPGGAGEVPLNRGTNRLIDQGMNASDLREYKVTGHLEDDDIVTALVMYAPATLFDPDVPDDDLPADAVDTTVCPDMAALKLMMFGILYEEASDLGNARSYISDALKVLDNKEQNQRGQAKNTVNIRPRGRGVSRIRSFR